jgi:hypothetical protein
MVAVQIIADFQRGYRRSLSICDKAGIFQQAPEALRKRRLYPRLETDWGPDGPNRFANIRIFSEICDHLRKSAVIRKPCPFNQRPSLKQMRTITLEERNCFRGMLKHPGVLAKERTPLISSPKIRVILRLKTRPMIYQPVPAAPRHT